MLPYPNIDPVLIHIGPIPYLGSLAIRWYSLAYMAGILLGWWLIARETAVRPLENLTKKAFDDMVMWAVLGIILGGRLGYVLFYKPGYYLAQPLEILHIWQGGMSFHGGLIGTILAFYVFARKHNIRFLALMDLLAVAAPIGLFFGRLANFINGELYGRVTDAYVGMVFPTGGAPNGENWPRHPSQLYEATLEGAVLFFILLFLLKKTTIRNRVGALSGIFLIGYGFARIICEHFREPDAFLGFIYAGATMGQLLCLPMLALGFYLLLRTSKPTWIAEAELDMQAVEKKRATLKELKRDESGWDTLYIDPKDNSYWELSYTDSHMHGGGVSTLLSISKKDAEKKYGNLTT